jgi:hypothetical protein
MLHPELGRLGFRIALVMTLASAGLLFDQRPGSAEFVLVATTLTIGSAFLLLIGILIRWSGR